MNTKSQTITLLGKQYPFRFGFKFQKIFMDLLEIQKITEYQRKLGLLEKMESIEAFDALGAFVIAGVQAASKKKLVFDSDEVVEDLMSTGGAVLEIMAAEFVKSQPKGDLGKSKK